MQNLDINVTHPAELPPNPPILGDFRAKPVSKSPRIGDLGGEQLSQRQIDLD
jgi:hypothetical protein